ncbi:hypothetical protein B0H14DRAFT_3743722 [Mycena olivaceomarginata]|nr:hypothetical protein B0H14DRAFT_3743722 [Mycena olivaceomarginata]
MSSAEKAFPGKNRAVVSSLAGGIAAYDENVVVWGLPESYLPNPVKFVYDAGYLVFSRTGQNMIEIWHDGSHPLGLISNVFPPSTEQEAIVKASAAEYAAARHFYPAAAIPVPSEPQSITMNYPILVAATSSAVYVWNIQTAELMYSLNHEMSCPGLAISQKLIVAFDPQQIRFFSRTDGLLLSWVSPAIANSGKNIAWDAQLLPPMYGVGFPGAVLSPQDVVPQTAQVVELEGTVYTSYEFLLHLYLCVGISGCGTTLAILSSKRRILVVNDIQRLMLEDLPISSASVDVKIPESYGLIDSACLAVTRDRIAVGTSTGILILTLDRSSRVQLGSSSAANSIYFCLSESKWGVHPVRLGASFVRFEKEMHYGVGHLEFAGSKLFFTREPETRAVGLGSGMPVPGGTEGEEEEEEEEEEEDGSDGALDSNSGDFLPRLQSLSPNSESSGEDSDESDPGDSGGGGGFDEIDGTDAWLDYHSDLDRAEDGNSDDENPPDPQQRTANAPTTNTNIIPTRLAALMADAEQRIANIRLLMLQNRSCVFAIDVAPK